MWWAALQLLATPGLDFLTFLLQIEGQKRQSSPENSDMRSQAARNPSMRTIYHVPPVLPFWGVILLHYSRILIFLLPFFFFFAQICNYTNIWYYITLPPRFCFFIFSWGKKKKCQSIPLLLTSMAVGLSTLCSIFPLLIRGAIFFLCLIFFFYFF